jgi:hypothetical protein
MGNSKGKTKEKAVLLSVFYDDYFIGALQRPGLANQLTIAAPAAVVNLENGNCLTRHHQCTAPADSHTKTATVTPGRIKYGQG